MGTDLCPIGNNTLVFENKTFEELANEIKTILDGIVFSNAEFLRLYALNDTHDVRKLHKLKTEDRTWNYEPEERHYSAPSDPIYYIEFNGPYDLHIDCYPNKIGFDTFGFRFNAWFNTDDIYFKIGRAHV